MPNKTTIALLVAAALTGVSCGDDASDPSAAAPQAGAQAPAFDESAAAAAKPKGDAQVATRAEDFLPVLAAAHARVTWPADYVMTVDGVWRKMSGAAADVILTDVDAQQSVSIWNVCAWTLQLVDDTKGGKDAAADTRALEGLAANDPGLRQVVDQIVSGARLGDVGTAEQFIDANGCADGFQ